MVFWKQRYVCTSFTGLVRRGFKCFGEQDRNLTRKNVIPHIFTLWRLWIHHSR